MKNYLKKIMLAALFAGALAFVPGTGSVQAAEAEAVQTQDVAGRVEITKLEVRTYNQIDIEWTPVENAAFYRVYRSTTKTGGYKSIKTVYGTSYTADADTGVAYYYKIMPLSYDETGKKIRGKCSVPQSITAKMSAPTGVTVTNSGNNSLTVSWDLSDADAYAILRSTTGSGYKVVKKVSGDTASWTDTTVEAGTKYYYKIGAGKSTGTTISYGTKSAAKSKWTKSEAPTDLSAVQNGSGGVSLGWTASQAASSYRLYRATGGSGTYELIASKITGCSYTDSGLTSGETYSYRLTAVHGSLVSDMGPAVSIRIGSLSTNTRTLYLGPGTQAVLNVSSEMSGTVSWVSEDPSVASVAADGTVTGVAPGTTTVNATLDGVSAGVTVTVTDATVNGIDVSRWQQAIDWATVKASGIRFAMLRLTYGTSVDIQFENYYSGASAQGIKVGAYCYTRAKSVEQGIEEAQNLVSLLGGRQMDYPVALDLEDDLQIKNMTKAQRTQLILEYKQIIEAAGYDFVVYANLNWLNNYIDQSKLEEENVDIWIARYRGQSLGHGYAGGGNVRIWQYSSTGQVDGILDAYGRYINVDLDVCYEDY